MEANLASNADAQLILKLYELRMEATMRAARQWFTAEFSGRRFRRCLKRQKSC